MLTDVANVSLTICRFQQNLAAYQNLITQSMYDKQLDSGKGTLLHLCDDVIQQEVSFKLDVFFPIIIIYVRFFLFLPGNDCWNQETASSP